MRKVLVGICSIVFVLVLGVGFTAARAWAAKVDCTKVMSELNSGKKAKDVAQDLKISTSSVYRCRRKAGTSAKSGGHTMAASPAASPAAHR